MLLSVLLSATDTRHRAGHLEASKDNITYWKWQSRNTEIILRSWCRCQATELTNGGIVLALGFVRGFNQFLWLAVLLGFPFLAADNTLTSIFSGRQHWKWSLPTLDFYNMLALFLLWQVSTLYENDLHRSNSLLANLYSWSWLTALFSTNTPQLPLILGDAP